MCDLMFASSPSWYCSTAIDADKRGYLYFAANYNLYILNVQSPTPKYALHLHAHQQRALGVSVCKDMETWKCCTIGEDGKTRVWDLHNKTCILEHSAHKNPLTCVNWSPIDSNRIVTSDNKGGIVLWHQNTSEFQYFCPESSHIFSLSCSPHRSELIAVGYKSGNVLVIDTNNNGQVVQRLRGHDEEIHGVCWCPEIGEDPPWLSYKEMGEHNDSPNGKGCLLATSSKDRTIRVWALSSGRSLITLKLPPGSGYRRDKGDDRAGGRVWVGLHWPPNKPMQLVSSSFNGDLLLWDLGRHGKQKWQFFSSSKNGKSHTRVVFNVVTAGSDYNILCTSSMDRHISLWDMDTLKAIINIPTLGGFGYCLTASPVSPGRLAVGGGDNLIRIWNIDNKLNPFETQVFWQGLKSKVTALSWHPVKEGLLAYGTEDGRVGIYEVFTNKSPQISSTYHHGTVYNVTWGPPCANHDQFSETSYFLYSCGDGKILQHEPYQLDKQALNLTKVCREANSVQGKAPGHSEMSFKPDKKFIAIGSDDGSIEILKVPSMKKLCSIQIHRKLVNVIKWHPEYTADSRQLSKYSSWIATGSGDPDIHVIDLSAVIKTSEEDSAHIITESKCQLSGHTGRITQLCWSSFSQGMLASVSFDHTVQIWDVKTCEPVCNYRGHSGRLLCVQWSEVDPDVVYSSGQDNTVQCWKISQQQHKVPPVGTTFDKKKKSKKKRNNYPPDSDSSKATLPNTNVNETNNSMEEIQELLEKKRQQLLANASTEVHSVADAIDKPPSSIEETELNDIKEDDSVDLDSVDGNSSVKSDVIVLVRKDGKDKKKKKNKSLLPKSSLRDNRGKIFQHQDCVRLAEFLYKGKPDTLGLDMFHVGHFIDRKFTLELVNYEVKHHKGQESYEQRNILEVMKGNIDGMIRQSADNGQLTDWLVGLSPMGSSAYWRDTAQQFARQLEKDGHCHKAMSYLLASNQVNEAIDLLTRTGAYKDAVCLARLRLPSMHPKLMEIYTLWANVLAKDSNLEMAAKCYLACMEAVEAAKCLARRTDLSALKAAVLVCVTANEMESAKVYAHRFIQDCYSANDWLSAEEVIDSHDEFKSYSIPVSCHELLVLQLTRMSILPRSHTDNSSLSTSVEKGDCKTKLPSFIMEPDEQDEICVWPVCLVNDEAFPMAVIRVWVEKWNVELNTNSLLKFYSEMKTLKMEKHGLMQLHQVLVSITYDIVLGLLQLLLGEGDQAALHWTSAIATCVNQDQSAVAEGLCQLLLPQGVGRFMKMAQQIHALNVSTSDTSQGIVKKVSFSSLLNLQCEKKGDDSCSSGAAQTIQIHSDKDICCPIDSLKAYYCLVVLKHWQSCFEETVCSMNNDSKNETQMRHTTCDTTVNRSDCSSSKSPGPRCLSNDAISDSPVKSDNTILRSPKKSNNSVSNSPVNIPTQNENSAQKGTNLSKIFSPAKNQNSVSEGIKLAKEGSISSVQFSLPCSSIAEVARSLLWDVIANKQRLEDSLVFIQKAIGDMITKHNRGVRPVLNSDNNQGLVDSIEKPTVSPINLVRAPSGEYLVMNKNENKRVLPIKKRKPHNNVFVPDLDAAQDCKARDAASVVDVSLINEDEEFVTMNAVNEQCTSECDISRHTHSTSVSSVGGEELSFVTPKQSDLQETADDLSAANGDTVSGNGDQNLTDACVLFSNVAEEKDLSKALFSIGPCEDSATTVIGNMLDNRNGVTKQVPSSKSLDYTGIPDDWFELPVDIRYKEDCVTLQVLTVEQQSVEAELDFLNKQLQNTVFPSVMTSARYLTNVLLTDDATSYQKEIIEQLLIWMERHSYLSAHLDTINNLKLQLDNIK